MIKKVVLIIVALLITVTLLLADTIIKGHIEVTDSTKTRILNATDSVYTADAEISNVLTVLTRIFAKEIKAVDSD
ncbi:MAG: hypothetical protein KGY74_05225, partial [Candidatus Cloacimonetes bacterium]|nr:hypothetical protein [Candidatus Cloacimonadota bacterium]